ncbi:MAG: autotransporter domain-containing protein, partial [Desulfovibrionaceae bacterium]|nr:autotransporter domain-containing protein [Desulfovibrionaceae bacterium]
NGNSVTVTDDIDWSGAADIWFTPQSWYGVVAAEGGSINYTGSSIKIAATAAGTQSAAVRVHNYTNTNDRPIANLGGENTELIVISNSRAADDTTDGTTAALIVRGNGNNDPNGGLINVTATEVRISSSANVGTVYGIQAQNSSTAAPGEVATINISADRTYIDVSVAEGADASAIVAYSQSVINIAGDLYVNTLGGSGNAILTRGFASTTINKAGTATVQLNGDIRFEYDKATSGTGTDATVDITLSGSDSYWNGNTVVGWESGTPPSDAYFNVTGVTVTLADGATWTPTAIENGGDETEGQYYIPLNNLALEDGNVDVASGVSIEVENVSGTGSLSNSGEVTLDAGTVSLALASTEGSSLTLGQTDESSLAATVTSASGAGAVTVRQTAALTFAGSSIDASGYDITSSGAVSAASGTTTLGSYTQTAGSLTVASGATLAPGTTNINAGSATVENGGTLDLGSSTMTVADGASVSFEAGSTLSVSAAAAAETAAITVAEGGTLTVASTSTLVLDDAVAGQTYTIVSGDSEATWTSIQASSDMVSFTMSADGTVSTSASDATSTYSGISGEAGALLNALYAGGLNSTTSDAAGVRFLSRATDSRYLGSDKGAAVKAIESTARFATLGAVPQMTKMASDAGTNAAVARFGFATSEDSVMAINAAGDEVKANDAGFALWIAPMWQNRSGFGMEAGELDYGFNGNIGGVAIGADYTFSNNIRAGLLFNMGGGYAESSGDLSGVENSMTFWGLGAYAGWTGCGFGVMADVMYTSTWNSVEGSLDSRLGMGSQLEADIQASAITAGLRAEYTFETSALDFIPHVGVRYMSLNTYGYDVESSAGTILESDGAQQSIWTFPVGITFERSFELENRWHFRPSLDFTVIPAAGDVKTREDVRYTGLAATADPETQMMDYFTWQGTAGVEFGTDSLHLGVNYTLQAGQHSTGHGVFGTLRYEF